MAGGPILARWCIALLLVLALPSVAVAQGEPPSAEPASPPGEDPVVAACLTSFDKSQKLRGQKKLLEAKEELVACSQQSCPSVVTVKCQQWLEEVKRSIPSVVVTAKVGNKDIFDVQVFIDDTLRMPSLDGTSLEIDVGPRKIRAVRGKTTRERTVLISEGTKNRMVTFDFSPPKPLPGPQPLPGPTEPVEPPSGPGFSLPLLSWIGFGVGLAGIIAGSITGGFAFDRVGELADTCEGGVCDAEREGEFAPAAVLVHSSTISFAVGGAGIVLGVVGLFIDEEDESCQITSVGLSASF